MTHFQVWTSVYKIMAACSIGKREDLLGAAQRILEAMVAAHSIAGWDNPRLEEEAQWDSHGVDGGPCLIVRVKPTNAPKAYNLVFPVGWLLAEMVDVVLVMES